MSSAIISVLVVGTVVHVVGGRPTTIPNGNCCEIKDNNFKFNLQAMSGIYNIPNLVETANQKLRGTVMLIVWLVAQRRRWKCTLQQKQGRV